MRLKKFALLVIFSTLSVSSFATELSSGLVKEDIRTAAKKLAWGSAHRAWTAPVEAGDQPLGMDIGIESALIPRGKLLRMGDGAGVVPRVIPVPRLWMAWEFPEAFEASFDFGPGWLFDGVTTYGGAVQWTFYKEDAAVSVLGAYTYANAFGDLKSHTFDFALQVAKDLDLWQPYLGLGLIDSYAKASTSRTAPGNKRGYFDVVAIHGYVGFMTRLPAKVGFQFDFMNTQPSFAFLLAHEF